MKYMVSQILSAVKSWDSVLLLLFVVFLVVFRAHNAWLFNPYWGYDGGAHLDYIFSLAKGHFPSLINNTVAWHEPLYYVLFAGISRVVSIFGNSLQVGLKALSLSQVVLSLAVTYLSYRLIRTITSKHFAIGCSFVLVSLLPSMMQTSMFVTNELLNYFFIFLILLLALRLLDAQTVTRRSYLVLGVICALALLVKITAAILVLLSFAVVVATVGKHRGISYRGALALVLLPIIALQLPWQVYRSVHILSKPSINNTELMTPAPLQLDKRLDFFLGFDTDVFRFPYWYSGGRTFWSMLYADTFYDYYGSTENDNFLLSTPKNQLVRTTAGGDYVARSHFVLSSVLVWTALPVAAVAILGFFVLIRRSLQHDRKAAFLFACSVSLLFALIYMSYRYPYYDMGIVKALFIFPFILPLLVYGFDYVATIEGWSGTAVRAIVMGGLVCYLAPLVAAFWVAPYGY